MNDLNISNEMLMVGARSELGPITKKWVQDYRKLATTNKNFGTKEFLDLTNKYIDDVKRVMGINLEIRMYDIYDLVMAVSSQITFFGHSGTRWYRDPRLRIVFDNSTALKQLIKVDLKTARVSGAMAEQLAFTFHISHQYLTDLGNFTDDEQAATLLHEFGHIFDTFMYLGDYVWLNYYLTEGIEVMLGKKKDKLDLEIYNDVWLKENVPEVDYADFIENRNENTAKRVVFSAAKRMQRHHLTNNEITAKRREEQAADMFATRLGYGKALVSAMYKRDRYYDDPSLSQSTWFGECAKLFATVLFLPVALGCLLAYDPAGGDAYTMDGRYDKPMDRIVKVRRDLIAQLKQSGTLDTSSIASDIEAIDDMLKEYSNSPDTIDALINFFRPSVRKMRQNTKVEDDLEALMNNDLFLQAHKLRKL